MTSEQFAYWLQGFSELNEAAPTPEQWALIKAHLALVFQKVTPPLNERSALNDGLYQQMRQTPMPDLGLTRTIC